MFPSPEFRRLRDIGGGHALPEESQNRVDVRALHRPDCKIKTQISAGAQIDLKRGGITQSEYKSYAIPIEYTDVAISIQI